MSVGRTNAGGMSISDATVTAADIVNGKIAYNNNGKLTGTLSEVDATAVATDILVGKTAYNNRIKITGNMTNRGAVSMMPGTIVQYILPGFHNGSGTVAGDSDLIAANIKSGISIFGVVGNLTAAGLVKTGTKTITLDNQQSMTITGLGITPTNVIIINKSYTHTGTGGYYVLLALIETDNLHRVIAATGSGVYGGVPGTGHFSITMETGGFTISNISTSDYVGDIFGVSSQTITYDYIAW